MKSIFALTLCSVILCTSAVFGQEKETGFVPLFNGKDLTGWTSARSTGEGDWGAFSVNEASFFFLAKYCRSAKNHRAQR